MSPAPQPRIQSEIIWRRVDENTVVVSPHSGQMRVFNGTGSVIWELLANEQSVEAIQAYLVEQYRIPAEQADQDLRRFLAELRERGLIAWCD